MLDAANEAIESRVAPDTVDGSAWAVAWRTRAASWMTRHRSLLTGAISS